MKILMIIVLLQIGLGQGIQPLLGYYYGAKNFNRFNGIIKFANLLSIGLGLLLTTICLFFTPQFIQCFINSQEIIQYGVRFVRMMLISGPVVGILFIYTNGLQAVGASGKSLLLSLSRQGIIFIPLLFLLNGLFGLDGIVLSQPIADIISCFLAVLLFHFFKCRILS